MTDEASEYSLWTIEEKFAAAGLSPMIVTVDELNCLPIGCVIVDNANRIWQKWPGFRLWATPGVGGSFPHYDIELPARLLDDGL